jgi:DNA-binding NarL/FixJ family response regulator
MSGRGFQGILVKYSLPWMSSLPSGTGIGAMHRRHRRIRRGACSCPLTGNPGMEAPRGPPRARGARARTGLVLTTFETDSDIRRAVEAEATGYLLKDAPREELFRAIRATARGEACLFPSVAARLMGHVGAGGSHAGGAVGRTEGNHPPGGVRDRRRCPSRRKTIGDAAAAEGSPPLRW